MENKLQKEHARQAVQHFVDKLQRAGRGGLEKEDFARILQSGDGALADADVEFILNEFFDHDGAVLAATDDRIVSGSSAGLAWVDTPPIPVRVPEPLHRDLTVHIFGASGLERFSCFKIRPDAVRYSSLDPYVSVRCGDVHVDTSVLIDAAEPEWNQTLKVRIRFATNNFLAVQQFVRDSALAFHVYDNQPGGVTPQSVWLASAYLPLDAVLAAVNEPVFHTLLLSSPEIGAEDENAPTLRVSVSVSHGGVVEHFRLPEDVWNAKYRDAIEHDLGGKGAAESNAALSLAYGESPALAAKDGNGDGDGEEAEEVDESLMASVRNALPNKAIKNRMGSHGSVTIDVPGDALPATLSGYYFRVYEALRSKLPRRAFQLIAPDDSNTFDLLCSFVTPIPSQFESSESVAKHIAEIASRVPNIPFRDPFIIQAQVSGPHLALFNGYGTDLDLAILQASLLLGLGIDAYVAMGEMANLESFAVWVVVLSPELEFWDRRGKVFRDPALLPWARCGCVFNNRNIYINVQTTDLCARMRWTLRKKDWFRVLSKPAKNKYRYPKPCVPAHPLPVVHLPQPADKVKVFVSEIVKGIQKYRKDVLYIPVTLFHVGCSKVMQEAGNDPASVSAVLEDERAQLPSGVVWGQRRRFKLSTDNATTVVTQLIVTGLLDCSIPDVVYAIAGDYETDSWGTVRAWVHIGYLVELDKVVGNKGGM